MTRPVHDLVVTSDDGTQVGYYIYTQAETPIEVDLSKVNTGDSVAEAPGQEGGYYSVRDQDQPAIVYMDWSKGAGQKTYETDTALSSRFRSSSAIDTQNKGELRLAKSVTLAEDTDVEGVTLNALGKVFMAFTPAVEDPRDTLRYWDGAAWQAVPYTSTDPTTGIACMATDGQYIYAAHGGTDGVWRVADSDADGSFLDESLANWAAGADADGIQAMVYSGGYMYAAKADSVGYFDATPTWQQLSPAFLEPTVASFGLAAAANWVYWGTTKEGVTKLYRTQYDGTNEWFENVCDFPTGFVATCMAGYLNEVYIGGYYECATDDVGQGALYKIVGDTPYLLTVIGDNPDYSSEPSSITNDNRVWNLCPAGKDLYVLATRQVLRWDLDDGGWVNVCEVPQGTSSSFAWLTTGDLDYTATLVPDAGTWTASGTGTASIVSGTLHIVVTSGYVKTYTATPVTTDVLSNTTGTTMEVTLPASPLGTTSALPVRGSGGEFGFDDGTYQTRVRVSNPYGSTTQYRVALGRYITDAWDYSVYTTLYQGVAHTLRLICKGEWAALYDGDTLLATVTSLEDTSGTNNIIFRGGSDLTSGYVKYDSIYTSNDGAFAPGSEYEASSMGGLAVRQSKLYVGVNSIGYVISNDTYETEGWLRQSDSSCKSGSMAKRYHTLVVTHSELRAGEGIACDFYIDGAFVGGGAGTTSGTST
ncbi:MAG TPA: hypothetical protein VMW94_10030, partial [Actinomycetes bacterium]|nr:hypothetical protein [Actinomycetes bacterium]